MITPKITPANLKKINWQTVSKDDARLVFSDTKIKHKILGNLNVHIEKQDENYGFNRFLITVKNSYNKQLGYEVINMKPNDKVLQGFNITVEPEYRRKGFRIGELLRVFSVLEMLENKIQKFEIFSKNTAVYFHSKYKFVPNNIRFDHRREMLEAISTDYSKGFEKFWQKAKALLDKIDNPYTTTEEHRELCQKTNELTEEYIKTALKEKQPEIYHSFYFGFDMSITRENLEKNKGFYNQLFEKYGIDYKI